MKSTEKLPKRFIRIDSRQSVSAFGEFWTTSEIGCIGSRRSESGCGRLQPYRHREGITPPEKTIFKTVAPLAEVVR